MDGGPWCHAVTAPGTQATGTDIAGSRSAVPMPVQGDTDTPHRPLLGGEASVARRTGVSWQPTLDPADSGVMVRCPTNGTPDILDWFQPRPLQVRTLRIASVRNSVGCKRVLRLLAGQSTLNGGVQSGAGFRFALGVTPGLKTCGGRNPRRTFDTAWPTVCRPSRWE